MCSQNTSKYPNGILFLSQLQKIQERKKFKKEIDL